MLNYLTDSFDGLVILAAVSSSLLTLASCFKGPYALRWVVSLLFPFIVAYPIYWMPVWLGSDPSEYWAWLPICVGVPYLAGLICSLLIILIEHLVRKQRKIASTQSP